MKKMEDYQHDKDKKKILQGVKMMKDKQVDEKKVLHNNMVRVKVEQVDKDHNTLLLHLNNKIIWHQKDPIGRFILNV
jgi:hypothetical protein